MFAASTSPVPFLAPSIINPMRRDFFRHRLMIFFRQFVFRPSVKLQVKRPQRCHPIVEHLQHLVRRHAVGGDLEREVIGIMHLRRHAVAEIAQLDQIIL